MNRFWHRFIRPIIDTVEPKRMLEIGADAGWNTRNILEYCRLSGARVDIVDPAPKPSLHDVMAQFTSAEFSYYPLKSLHALPQLDVPDLALIDGDHNWYTVFHELTMLSEMAIQNDVPPPIVIAHDVAWPYARRDMYYNPSDVEAAYRQPYAYMGILPDQPELVEGGMNRMLANAVREGGPRNGVLTAIEDYIASMDIPYELRCLPFFNGLGILVPAPRMTPALNALLDSFYTSENLLDSCIALEKEAMQLRAMLADTEARLTRRTESLRRAQALLENQPQHVNGLNGKRIDAAQEVETIPAQRPFIGSMKGRSVQGAS
jgi:hypothetical protein